MGDGAWKDVGVSLAELKSAGSRALCLALWPNKEALDFAPAQELQNQVAPLQDYFSYLGEGDEYPLLLRSW